MAKSNSAKRPRLTNEGFMGRLKYFIARAMVNIRQNIFINAVAVVTIGLALLIFSLFLLLYVNLEGAAENWSKRVQVTVYFDQEISRAEVDQLKSKVLSVPGTATVAYISKEDAVKKFRSRLKGQESLLNGVTADILPASLEIGLKSANRSSEAVEAYVARLKKIPGVNEVQYGEEWVKKFNSFMNFARLVGMLLGAFLFIAVVFIVSNTIKLTIYSRKEELELLGLVGATRMFIKAPFLIEGIFQGCLGAAFALITLSICYFAFLHNAGNFLSFNPAQAGLKFLPFSHMACIFFGGISFGFLGSLTSLRRFVTL